MSALVHKPEGAARGDADLVSSEEILGDEPESKQKRKSKVPTRKLSRRRVAAVVERGEYEVGAMTMMWMSMRRTTTRIF